MERLELMVCPVKECGAWWVRHGGWGRHCEHGQRPITYVPEKATGDFQRPATGDAGDSLGTKPGQAP